MRAQRVVLIQKWPILGPVVGPMWAKEDSEDMLVWKKKKSKLVVWQSSQTNDGNLKSFHTFNFSSLREQNR